jgi:hypothetical protein
MLFYRNFAFVESHVPSQSSVDDQSLSLLKKKNARENFLFNPLKSSHMLKVSYASYRSMCGNAKCVSSELCTVVAGRV